MSKAGSEMKKSPAIGDQLHWLGPNEVHVWMAAPNRCCHPELINQYVSWLDEQERSRYERFHFRDHRHEYLVAHALLRSTLSHYGDRQPAAWSFVRNAYGRPEIEGADGRPPLRFNLSHTAGLVVCAVTRSAAIGVDVEAIGRMGDLAAIAAASCAPVELADLNALAGDEWVQHFFSLWTLKEAYCKAVGKGLSMPLQQIQFRFKLNAIEFTPLLEPKAGRKWQFALLRPIQSHSLAVAVHLPGPLHIQGGWAVPGEAFQPYSFPAMTSDGLGQSAPIMGNCSQLQS